MLRPMLATPRGELDVSGSDWIHEFKWDGIRVLVAVDDGGVQAMTRNGNDVAVAWPELAGLATKVPAGTVLDGELVVLDDDQRPDFSRVAHRMHARNPTRVARLRREHPGRLFVFDLLMVGGTRIMDQPVERRRATAAEVLDVPGPWGVPPSSDDLSAMTAVVEQRNIEGIVSKRRGSPYRPGERSGDWRKWRRVREIDAVVVGCRGSDAPERGPVTSLALARWDPTSAAWAPMGSVGSGIGDGEGRRLRKLCDHLRVDEDVAATLPVPDGFQAVGPALVVRVRYLEATPDGQLRHPVYLGHRPDGSPLQVTDLP